jgi:3-isopropylmalate dehydrogenase
VARVAFELARTRRRHLISVDKANVLITSQLWRDRVTAIGAQFPDVTLEHRLIDSFAMHLIKRPTAIDVVVTDNLFGDILSDEAAILAGSLGMLPSAGLSDTGRGLYEPVHGSAPDIAGKGIANPYGAILSVALMLRHSLHRDDLAWAIEAAVDRSIADGVLTPDVGGEYSTALVAEAVLQHLQAVLGGRGHTFAASSAAGGTTARTV